MRRFNDGAKRIDPRLPAAAAVFRHAFYQCRLVVLDSAAGWQDSLATVGWIAGGLEYVSAVLSKHAANRIRVCARVFEMAQPACAGGGARRSHTVDCNLPLPVAASGAGSKRGTTGKPDTMVAEEPAVFGRSAVLHHFRDESFTAKLVFDVAASRGC